MKTSFFKLFLAFTLVFTLLALIMVKFTPLGQRDEEHEAKATEEVQPRDQLSQEPPKEVPIEEKKEKVPRQDPLVEDQAHSTQDRPQNQVVPNKGKLICLDPGHQAKANLEKETLAPSSSQTKAKVSSGTRGVATGIPEYQFNLNFSLVLADELIKHGYQVVLTRTQNEVNFSNQERAQMANSSGASLYLRIHANGTSSSSVEGIETYFVSPENPDAGQWSSRSRRLSQLTLEEMVRATGAKNRGAHSRDDLTGSNFATLPTSLLELGYMSNPSEDQKLNDPTYQRLLAQGIVKGIDRYFEEFAD